MKSKLFILFLLVLLLLPFNNQTVSADMGPKPDVSIEVKGLEGQTYYMTLLSKSDSLGPWSVDGEFENAPAHEKPIWEAFKSYQDKDNYNFINYYGNCSDTNNFAWGYWPPDQFKVLIYLPETNTFIVSSSNYERYAFHSNYTATVKDGTIVLEKIKTSTDEFLPFCVRILLTLVIELGIALLFYYRSKKQLGIIAMTNLFTQIILNIILFNMNRTGVSWFGFYLYYLLLEIAILIIEGFAYSLLIPRYAPDTKRRLYPWVYSFVANISSFGLGILLVKWVPGVF